MTAAVATAMQVPSLHQQQHQHTPVGLTSIGEMQQAAACSGFDVPSTHSSGSHVVYDDVPTVVHASEQKYIKSEDVIFVRSTPPVLGDVHSLFIVCDGHMGVGAANHCVQHMPQLLRQLLPQHLPDWTNNSEVETYAEAVRRGISTAAVLLDNDWARLNDSSGTTLTMAVLSGWLLTIANTGDSNAIIDCGDDVKEITHSHRIQVNKAEQSRLREAGAQLAPVGFHLQGPAKPQEMGVGPLRMWPGGLCVSRSIGDLDAGPLIVPLPHVRQVVVNRNRALRLIMASDGLWDLMTFSKAAKSVRHKLPTAAVNALVQMAVRDRRMADDVSIIIADVLPPPTPGATPPQFPAAALKTGSSPASSSGSSSSTRSRSSGGGLFGCFKSSAVDDHESAAVADSGAIQPPLSNNQQLPPQPPQQQQQRRSMDLRNTFAGGLARLSGRGFGAVRRPGPSPRPWPGLVWFADVDCFEAYPLHKNQLARTEPGRVLPQRPKTPPKGDYTVHGGQAHRFQQDSSWHAGNSQHGAGSSQHGPTSGDLGLPLLLSQQQLEQLQADGPAAAASMHFTGMQQQQVAMAAVGSAPPGSSSLYASGGGGGGGGGNNSHSNNSGSLPSAFSGAGAGVEHGTPGMVGQQQQSAATAVPLIMRANRSIVVSNNDDIVPLPPPSAAAAAGGGGSGRGGYYSAQLTSDSAGVGTPGAGPASGLNRCASAQFEVEGTSGVYVAESGGAGGRVVKPMAVPASLNHFGSAPDAVVASGSGGSGGRGGAGGGGVTEGRVHRGSLAAAAAEDSSNQHLHSFGYGI